MQRLARAGQSVLAILAGIVALTALAFAVELPLRALVLRWFLGPFPDAAALDAHPLWMLSQWLYTVPALIVGGYVAARLAPGRGMAHALALAVVQELLIVALIFNPPHPVPAWVWGLTLVVTPLAIAVGGYLAQRRFYRR